MFFVLMFAHVASGGFFSFEEKSGGLLQVELS